MCRLEHNMRPGDSNAGWARPGLAWAARGKFHHVPSFSRVHRPLKGTAGRLAAAGWHKDINQAKNS